jgi:hypothetical protein
MLERKPVCIVKAGFTGYSVKPGETRIFKVTNKNQSFPYSRFNLGLELNYRL